MRKNNVKTFFADLESYASKYYEIFNRVDAYVWGAKELNSKGTDEELIWDVDFNKWLNLLIEVIEDNNCDLLLYFHNLGGFDSHFIFPLLYKRFNKENITYFVDDKNKTYQIKLKIEIKKRNYYINFYDSIKIWSLPLAALGAAVGMKKLDYGNYDILDRFDTKEDYAKHNKGKSLEYFERDIDILIKYAKESQTYEYKGEKVFDLKNYKLTIASTAKSNWENIVGKDIVNQTSGIFKKERRRDIECWDAINKAYRGGLTINNPKYQLKLLHNVHVYDVNSLYPSIMLNEKLPIGDYKTAFQYNNLSPTEKEKYTYKIYALEVNKATAKIFPFINVYDETTFKPDVEDDEIPSMRGYNWEFKNKKIYLNNYMKSYFEKYYTINYNKQPQLLYAFKEQKGNFDEYIYRFKEIKENSSGAIRTNAKLSLNSLYGKFAQNKMSLSTEIALLDDIKDEIIYENDDDKKLVFPYIWKEKPKSYHRNSDGEVSFISAPFKSRVTFNDNIAMYKVDDGAKKKFSYIPIAEAITSKAKIKLIDAIVANIDNFIYADTDSIHLTKPAKGIELDDSLFGAWKYEGKWDDAIYRRPKHYYHKNKDGKYELKGGGLKVNRFSPKNLKFNNYLKESFSVEEGKTGANIVSGGVLITSKEYRFSMPDNWKALWGDKYAR